MAARRRRARGLAALVVLASLAGLPRAAHAVTGTTTIISANGQNTVTYGQSVTFTVVVTSASLMGQPSGMVTLDAGGAPFATVALVSDGPGSASSRVNYSTRGPDLDIGGGNGMLTITASYAGDGSFSSSKASRVEMVNKNPAAVSSLTVTPNPCYPGQEVTISASVTAGGNHVTGLGLMTGSVMFGDGMLLGAADEFVSDPVLSVYNVTFKTSLDMSGDRAITAYYTGDDNNLESPVFDAWVQTVLELVDLTIAGPDMVGAGKTGAYTGTATWSDGSKTVVAPDWSVDHTAKASIDGTGTLTAAAGAAGPVVITASYTAGGDTVMAMKTVTITPNLMSLTINGPGEVVESSMVGYTATAGWSDGTTSMVTPTWTVAPGLFASIGADGVLTTAAVTARQVETITASYTFDGVTKTASKAVGIGPAVPGDGGAGDAGPGNGGDGGAPADGKAPDGGGSGADAGNGTDGGNGTDAGNGGTGADAGSSGQGGGGCSFGGATGGSVGRGNAAGGSAPRGNASRGSVGAALFAAGLAITALRRRRRLARA